MDITKENFRELFIANFLPDTPVKQLKKLHCYPPRHGLLWNVCESSLVNHLKGADASVAYDYINKAGAMEMQYDGDRLTDDEALPLSEENDTAEKIRQAGLMEFYVIGKDFSWCYVVTHEGDHCGPYFIMK